MFHFEVFIPSAYFYIPHGSLILFFVSYLFSIYSLRRKSLYQYFIHNSTESKVTAKQANTGVLWGVPGPTDRIPGIVGGRGS